MAKCCEGDWDSTINGQPDGVLSIHSEDEVTGDIQGNHGGQIKVGKCKGGNVSYEVEKNGKTYIYTGEPNSACTNIDGTRKVKNAAADTDDDVWVATKGSGGDNDEGKTKEKEKDKDKGQGRAD